MTLTRPRYFLLLLFGLVFAALTGCGSSGPSSIEATLPPVTPPTVTPGGMILMWLPTEGPRPTPTPEALLTTPNYLLTALPAGEDLVECPPPDNPFPPDTPASYNLYAATINDFLSSGGSIAALASILRGWEAVGDEVGLVTDSYDLTGDGVYEIMVIVADPFNAGISPQPGQLLVYGCFEQNYHLLYSSDYGPGFGLPTILHVGDMNADASPELVLFQQRCQGNSCVQTAQVLSWSAPNDGFITLNVDTVGSPDGRFAIQDLDGDGVLELMITGGGTSTNVSAGPPRSSTTIWDWNGLNYVRAVTRLDPPIYRIHVVHDADRALEQGDTETALALYQDALDNPRLGSWQVPNEPLMLRAYVQYRMITAYAYLERDGAALDVHSTLMAENTPSLPSFAYAALGDAFWRAFQSSHNMHTGCLAAAEVAAVYPQVALFLNSYGPANRTYQIPDLCPF